MPAEPPGQALCLSLLAYRTVLSRGALAGIQGDEALSVSKQCPAQGRCPTGDNQDEDADHGVRPKEGVEARKAVQVSQLEGEEKG